MTTALAPTPVPAPEPWPRVCTVAEFHRFGDAGAFECDGALMIDGQILWEGRMTPRHAVGIELTDDALRKAFDPGWGVRVRSPLVLGPRIDPRPDVFIRPGGPRDHTGHPRASPLIVEVSEASLAFDLSDKMSLYAAAGVTDYWVLDLNNRLLVVHRDPAPDAAQRFGHGYAAVTTLGMTDSVAPLAAGGAAVRVADLLP